MNNTKKALIITAIILNIINIGFNIYFIVEYFMLPEIEQQPLFYVIFEIFQIIAFIVCTCFLIYSISGNGQLFRKRYGFYLTAVMMALILNLFSPATIILIITMFIPDIVWVKPENNLQNEKSQKEIKIEQLRKAKEEGKITEEEFEKELLKLL